MSAWDRIDTLALKSEIERKLGGKATEYFDHLSKFLSCKITKSEFCKCCIRTIGKENVRLHNHLIGAILQNAELQDTFPLEESSFEGALSVRKPYEKGGSNVGYHLSPLGPYLNSAVKDARLEEGEVFYQARRNALSPNGKSSNIAVKDACPKSQEKQVAEPVDEEFDQLAGIHRLRSSSPIRAPFGVHVHSKDGQGVLNNLSASSNRSWICRNTNDLPDNISQKRSLEQKLEKEGLKLSADCADLINKSLELYLKRLVKPCLDVAWSRCHQEQSSEGHFQGVANNMEPVIASMSDFQAAMEINPSILGHQWPTQLEKIALWESQNQMEN